MTGFPSTPVLAFTPSPGATPSTEAAAAASATTNPLSLNPDNQCKSKRVWKSRQARASQRVAVKTLHEGFAKRMQKTAIDQQFKTIQKERKEEVAQERQREKEARKQRMAQKLANEKRNEVVQTITNARKLKRLSKKKMRSIQKTS